MPEYSFICDNCEEGFSLFFSINDYAKQSSQKKISCPACNSKKVNRDLLTDCSTIAGSVKKGDGELKTIGDLANRNRDRMSDDQKAELYKKHNSYRESEPETPLPAGMTRIDTKKRKKTIWPS